MITNTKALLGCEWMRQAHIGSFSKLAACQYIWHWGYADKALQCNAHEGMTAAASHFACICLSQWVCILMKIVHLVKVQASRTPSSSCTPRTLELLALAAG